MVDLLCSEYGWTIDQVFDHTKDQVAELMKVMMKRISRDLKFQAELHGATMKGGPSDNTVDVGDDLSKIGINVVKG